MKSKLVLCLFLFVLAAGITATLLIVRNNQQSCTIGTTGYAATLTITGPTSHEICDHFLATPMNTGNYTYYLYDGSTTGTELCSGDHQWIDVPPGSDLAHGVVSTYHYTVKDTGVLDSVGNQLCTMMTQSG